MKAPLRGPDDEKVWLTMNSTTVSAELGLRLVVPDRTTVPLLAGLSYTAEDPYAIRMAFHVGNDEPVEWIFARELLTVGIVRRVGDGDVQVWPARSDGERTLNISLTSPFGQALFEVPLAPLTEFLHRTYELVPAGREVDFMDLDEELTNMLWSS
ncbi:SsgA family sporulation/cell division regulator [Acrocarpospora macrocephala]|uniref:Sporulation-specific cell division protein SsgB n=2 Tax=Streptosporangiaceae TaxID=2004 RepID=A0A5M3WHF9_9ACTN|nr:sporulation-specific cell division protein SsgB [Acrocarpospora macrocephala]